MTRPLRTWPVASFLLLAVGISTLALVVTRFGPASLAATRIPITVAKFGPTIAGILVALALFGGPGVTELIARHRPRLRHWHWYGAALIAPGLLFFAAAWLSAGGSLTSSLTLPEAASVLGRQSLQRVFLGGGLGEELGWRGVLLPLLAVRFGAIRAALLVGLAHGFWHMPANGVASTVALTALTVPWGVLLAWTYFRTGGQLLPCVLMHGFGNAWAALFAFAYPGLGAGWMLGVIALSWAGALLVIPELRRMQPHHPSRWTPFSTTPTPESPS